jgi:hypothetical protein
VKTRIQSFSFLATLAMAMGMICWGGALSAQTTPSSPSDQQTPQTQPTPSPDMPPAAQQPPTSPQTPDTKRPRESGSNDSNAAGSTTTDAEHQTFSGTVVKQGDKYVLKDDSGKVYDIDHQDDVKKFEGKRVRVQGTLDPSGKIAVK